MIRLLSRPLTYLVLGECCVLIALGVAVWHLIPHPAPQSRAALTPAPPGAAPAPAPEARPAQPPPAAPHPPPSSRPPSMGSATAAAGRDPAFWAERLKTLNRDQSELQQSQWRLLDAALGAARGYLDEVVVPAVERAQREHQPRAQSRAG